MEIYLDKFDPLSMVTPRGMFCVNKGETDPNRVSLKQNKTSSLANMQGNKYTKTSIHTHMAPAYKSAGVARGRAGGGGGGGGWWARATSRAW